MTDIAQEVAAFRDDLAGLAVFDPAQIAADIAALTNTLLAADTHEDAAVALREFVDTRPQDADYAKAIVIASLAQVSLQIILVAHPSALDGASGYLRRLKRLAMAARGLGLQTWGMS